MASLFLRVTKKWAKVAKTRWWKKVARMSNKRACTTKKMIRMMMPSPTLPTITMPTLTPTRKMERKKQTLLTKT